MLLWNGHNNAVQLGRGTWRHCVNVLQLVNVGSCSPVLDRIILLADAVAPLGRQLGIEQIFHVLQRFAYRVVDPALVFLLHCHLDLLMRYDRLRLECQSSLLGWLSALHLEGKASVNLRPMALQEALESVLAHRFLCLFAVKSELLL